MFPGETLSFGARAWDADGRLLDVEVEWSSGNPAVMEAAADGTMRALAPGLSIITARAGGKEARAQVRVSAPPAAGLLLTAHAPFGGGSPDGRTLAFRSIRHGLADVWTIRLDGTGLHNVTDLGGLRPGLLGAERPAFSPDGQWIAFAWGDRGIQPARTSLAIIRPDGSDRRQVTQPSTYEDAEPSFSPDGQRLAFRRNGNGLTHRIMTTDLAGNIDIYAYDLGSGRTPRWSPDGSWLAYLTMSPGLPDYGQVVLKPIGHADERRVAAAFDVAWR